MFGRALRVVVAVGLWLCLVSSVALAGPSQVVYAGSGECRWIALTFDIEFYPGVTERIADALERGEVRATVFFLGEQVGRYPALVRRLAARHEVGNHTWDHADLTRLSAEGVRRELARASAAIAEVAGVDPHPLFRPPYGAYNATVLKMAGAMGYPQTVMWNVDSRDSAPYPKPPAAEMAAVVLRSARPGSIVLAHGFWRETPAALDQLVPALRSRGYQFVSVSEILGRREPDFGGTRVVVQPGDTWDALAACARTGAAALAARNGTSAAAGGPEPGSTLLIPARDEVTVRLGGDRLPMGARIQDGVVTVDAAQVAYRLRLTQRHLLDGTVVLMNGGAQYPVGAPGTRPPLLPLLQALGLEARWDPAARLVTIAAAPPKSVGRAGGRGLLR